MQLAAAALRLLQPAQGALLGGGFAGHVDAFNLRQPDEFDAPGIVSEEQCGIVPSKRGEIGVLHTIFATAYHANGKGLGVVEDVTDMIEGHSSR